jgi:hypothetical protein
MIDAGGYEMRANEAVRRGSAYEIAAGDQPEVARACAYRQRAECHRHRIAGERGIRPRCTAVAVRAKTDILGTIPHQEGRERQKDNDRAG